MSDLSPGPPKTHRWMTVIPDRSPRVKTHATKGVAHSALAYPRNYGYRTNHEGALYELVGDEWELRWSGTLNHNTKPWKGEPA
jgi:hypothetical protein